MENSQEQTPVVQHAVRYGVIIGVIGIVLTLLAYAVDYTWLVNWKFGICMIVLTIGYVIYAGITYRKEVGGYLSYGKAFQHGFITMAVGGIIGIIFGIVLYNVIDSELPQKLTDTTIENTQQMMANFGAPEDKIDEAIEKMKTDIPKNYTILGQLKTYLWALLVYAIIAAITSLIVKKSQPEVM